MKIPKKLDSLQFREYFEYRYKDLILLDDYISGSEKVSVQCRIDDYV
jgi:hypothetical protein